MVGFLKHRRGASGIAVTAFLILGSMGCGGGGGGVNSNRYSGAYAGESGDTSGDSAVVLDINNSGIFTGTANNGGTVDNLSGSVGNAGGITVTSSSGTDRYTGTFTSPTAPTIGAILTDAANGQQIALVLVVHPTAGVTGGSPFAGDYAGTQLTSTSTTPGPVALTISSGGVISGSLAVAPNGTPEIATLSGTIGSTGTVSLTAAANGTSLGTGTGTFNLASSSLTGTLNNSDGSTINFSLRVVGVTG